MKLCVICGKPIPVRHSHEHKRKTCGKECGGKWISLTRRGENNSFWKGGKTKDVYGYVLVRDESNKRPNNSSHQIKEHVAIAENAMGKPLPFRAMVHHFNGIKSDNRNSNLIVCENNAYHKLLHMRQKAFIATGDVNKRKCKYCKQWDDVENLHHDKTSGSYLHRPCANKNEREKRAMMVVSHA
jgi:hypothetical protein